MRLRSPLGITRVRSLSKVAILCSCLTAATLVSVAVRQSGEEQLDVVLVQSEAAADPSAARPRSREVALVLHEAMADGARSVRSSALASAGRGRAGHKAQATNRPAEPSLSLQQYDDKMFLAGAYADFRGAVPQLLVTAFGYHSYTRQLYCKHENQSYRARGRFINYSDAAIARWRAIYFTCSVPGLRRPVVTVTLGDRRDSASDVTLPVRGGGDDDDDRPVLSSSPAQSPPLTPLLQPLRPRPKQFVGVCVKSSYGTLDARRAVEWMELNEILGVDHVILYNASLAASAAAEATLRHYEARSRLTVVRDEVRQRLAAFEPSLAPLLDHFDATYSTGNEPHPQSQLLSLQDCLHRYRDRFEYLLVIDLDEVLVPTAERSVPDLIRSLRRQNQTVGSFSFLAAEYLEEYGRSEGNAGSGPLLPHALAITRHAPPSYEQAKTVHSTADTAVINWHRRLLPVGGNVRVSRGAAWLHHYRKRCKGKACRSGARWHDDGASRVGRFADELRDAVERAVSAIGAGLFV